MTVAKFLYSVDPNDNIFIENWVVVKMDNEMKMKTYSQKSEHILGHPKNMFNMSSIL